MKKVVALVLGILLSLSFVGTAFGSESELPATNIDFDAMTVDQLVVLKDLVEAKLAEKLGDPSNLIATGTYHVGVDIRSGNFVITNLSGSWCNYDVYDSEDDFKSRHTYAFGTIEPGDSWTVNLHEGQVLELSHLGAGSITEQKMSWAP